MVNSATEDKVVLSENIDGFDQLTPFEEAHYIRAHEADVSLEFVIQNHCKHPSTWTSLR